MNDVAPKEPRSLDEFADWTDEVESGEQSSERSIIGQRVRFSNEGQWLLADQTELTKLLIAVNTRRTAVKWGKTKGGPVETIFLKAGEKFPDLAKRNEETPKSEWIEGFDGKPKGPWEAQHILYLLDPVDISQYSYPTSTVGGGIAVRELVDRIMWMRRLRGNAVYPVVQLTTRLMRTKFAGRLRPHFEIVDWTKIDPDSGGMIPVSDPQQVLQQPAEQLPAAATGQAEKMQAVLHTIGIQTVEPPSAKEATDDEIKF
jgi:hypothetical protein